MNIFRQIIQISIHCTTTVLGQCMYCVIGHITCNMFTRNMFNYINLYGFTYVYIYEP